jgi:hypothetical protein
MMPPRAGARRCLPLVSLAGLLPGCGFLPETPMMATVPREWRNQHPFGPAANAARERGELKDRFYTDEMASWNDFAREHIEEGDLLFRFGRSYGLTGKLTSRVLAKISAGPFSHNAFVHGECGRLWVFDAENEGIRKVPFDHWILDVTDGSLAVRRLRPEYRCAIPVVLAYIEDAYYRNVPFDHGLRLDDEKLYCSELIEKGFRSAGLVLSEPIPIRCLPRYAHYAPLRPIVERFTEIRVDEPVFTLGNPCYGAFASPLYESVYEERRVMSFYRHPKCPTCGAGASAGCAAGTAGPAPVEHPPSSAAGEVSVHSGTGPGYNVPVAPLR